MSVYCEHGHLLSPENTYTVPGVVALQGYVFCLRCRKRRKNAKRALKRYFERTRRTRIAARTAR